MMCIKLAESNQQNQIKSDWNIYYLFYTKLYH